MEGVKGFSQRAQSFSQRTLMVYRNGRKGSRKGRKVLAKDAKSSQRTQRTRKGRKELAKDAKNS